MFDEYANVLLILALIMSAAMVVRWISDRCRQPSVLGELLLGVLGGNIGYWLGHPLFGVVMHLDNAEVLFGDQRSTQHADSGSATTLATGELPQWVSDAINAPEGTNLLATVHVLWVLANLGILLLLFTAGLELNVETMRRVGRRAACVAGVGIAAPFALAFTICYLLHTEMAISEHLFLAATLSATSVGITARVLGDLHRLDTLEAEVILGAAVIDDILGLILLAVVAGIASTGAVDPWAIGRITLVAGLFLFVVLTFGERLAGWGAGWFEKLDIQNAGLLYPLGVAFAMAWLADVIQLAPIVGAFAAGLILNDRQFSSDQSDATINKQIAPVERFLAPVFFLFTGMQVNLAYFLDFNTLMLAAGFTVAAILGKAATGLVAGRDIDRLSVGLGMMPRGEVGLIFLSVGRGLGVISQPMFAALVVVVILTTLMTPPVLKWSLFRHNEPKSAF